MPRSRTRAVIGELAGFDRRRDGSVYRTVQRTEECFHELELVLLTNEPREIAELIHGMILVALAHKPASHRTQLGRPTVVGGDCTLEALAVVLKRAVSDGDEKLLFTLREVIVQSRLADTDLPGDFL